MCWPECLRWDITEPGLGKRLRFNSKRKSLFNIKQLIKNDLQLFGGHAAKRTRALSSVTCIIAIMVKSVLSVSDLDMKTSLILWSGS